MIQTYSSCLSDTTVDDHDVSLLTAITSNVTTLAVPSEFFRVVSPFFDHSVQFRKRQVSRVTDDLMIQSRILFSTNGKRYSILMLVESATNNSPADTNDLWTI